MTLLILSFVAGLLTVLAPCILPLLPVVLGGSLRGEHEQKNIRRPLTVVLALGVSIIAFTFLLKASTLLIAIPESTWKYISGGIIVAFGLISIFPTLWERVVIAQTLNQKSNATLGRGFQKKSFWGDVIIGSALGPVFSTCSPTYFVVLATVLPVSVLLGFTYILAYVFGLALALLSIAFVGQKVIAKLGIAANPHGKFKRLLGVVFLVVGIAIITGYDKKVELGILEVGFFDVTQVEQHLLQFNTGSATLNGVAGETGKEVMTNDTAVASTTETMPKVTGSESQTPKIIKPAMSKVPRVTSLQFASLNEKKIKFHLAPEIVGVDEYLNTGNLPVTIGGYRGKNVVLVHFWTYTCINCQHTLPYVTSWYEKYKDQGLVVLGIHTPEFAFEHNAQNVLEATKKEGINYPVILDNNYATWNAFGNQFWPHAYLVDIDGYVVYDHIGEGAYSETEARIVEALHERAYHLEQEGSTIN